MSRNILDVCEQIISVIPEIEYDLIVDINQYLDSTFNKAPEILHSSDEFYKVGFILSKHIQFNETDDDSKKWKKQVQSIFSNK